ncbi:carboxypeptidase-like regulatory domain-containing protein [Flavobacterium album]|nr:carboxypeptidase-like regulatory domain-containing protein [Flavobacterium album]
MTPSDKGRFCASCQKNVRDFTLSSDREIASAFAKGINLCGRFLPSQLDRELSVSQEKSPVWSAAAAILAMMSLGTLGVSAQTPVATEQQIPDETSPKMTEPSSLLVSGTITDFSGPLPNVAVTIKGTQACEMTDSNGKYSIEACSGQTIVFSHRGFILQEGTIADPDSGAIDISFEAGQLLDEIVVTGYGNSRRQLSIVGVVSLTTKTIEKRRTFFGRIFHAVGNVFR